MSLDEINQEISDVEVELDEAAECGDLEARLHLSLRLEDLRAQRLKASLLETGGL